MMRFVCMGCAGDSVVADELVHRPHCAWQHPILCIGAPGSWRPVGHTPFDRRGVTLSQSQLEGDGGRHVGKGWRR